MPISAKLVFEGLSTDFLENLANKLKELCEFLEFFKNITTAVEGDKYVTINNVWPTLRLLRVTPNDMDSSLVESMRNAGCE